MTSQWIIVEITFEYFASKSLHKIYVKIKNGVVTCAEKDLPWPICGWI